MGKKSLAEVRAERISAMRSREEAARMAMQERENLLLQYMEAQCDGSDIERRMLAESAMMRDGFAPPSMRGWVVCARCGPMMSFVGSGEEVSGCPWCGTGWGIKEVRQKLQEDLNEWEKNGPSQIREWLDRRPDIVSEWVCESVNSDSTCTWGIAAQTRRSR